MTTRAPDLPLDSGSESPQGPEGDARTDGWHRLPVSTLGLSCVASLALAVLLSGFAPSYNATMLALAWGLMVPFLIFQVRHFGLFAPGFLVGLAFLHYNLIIPLEYAINPDLPAYLAHTFPDLSSELLEIPITAAVFGAVGLLLGWSLGAPPRASDVSGFWAAEVDPAHLQRGAWIMLLVGAAAYFLAVTIVTGSPLGVYGVGYFERSQIESELGRLGMGQSLLFVGGMIVVATSVGNPAPSHTRRRELLWAILIVVAFGAHSVMAGAKVQIFLVGMAALIAWEQRQRRAGLRAGKWPALVVVAGVIAAVVLAIGPMRARLGLGMREMVSIAAEHFDWQMLNPANVDAYGPYVTLVDVANDRFLDQPQLGATYVNAALHVLPGSWVPDRAPQLHHLYADMHLGASAGDNETFAFSHLAEGYLNFGYLGALLQLAILGWVAGRLSRLLRVTRRSVRAIAMAAFAGPWLALSMRLGWDGIAREVIVSMAIPLLINDWLAVRATAQKNAALASSSTETTPDGPPVDEEAPSPAG